MNPTAGDPAKLGNAPCPFSANKKTAALRRTLGTAVDRYDIKTAG